jgi:hypothetical protein
MMRMRMRMMRRRIDPRCCDLKGGDSSYSVVGKEQMTDQMMEHSTEQTTARSKGLPMASPKEQMTDQMMEHSTEQTTVR